MKFKKLAEAALEKEFAKTEAERQAAAKKFKKLMRKASLMKMKKR